jgi:hypothetical protein
MSPIVATRTAWEIAPAETPARAAWSGLGETMISGRAMAAVLTTLARPGTVRIWASTATGRGFQLRAVVADQAQGEAGAVAGTAAIVAAGADPRAGNGLELVDHLAAEVALAHPLALRHQVGVSSALLTPSLPTEA